MSDLKDFTNKNTRFTGTIGEEISRGTTVQRDTSFGNGTIRFNTTTNLMEYYDGTNWKAIDAPPTISNFTVDGGSSVTSATVDNEKGGNFTFVISGSLFDTTNSSVTFVGSGETVATNSITRTNANSITCTVQADLFDASNSPYSLKVTNGSGLSANLADAISADTAAPNWYNAADTVFSIYDGSRGSVSISANDLAGANGGSSFSVSSGSLPTGLTMSSSDGSISGSTSAVGGDTTTTFTVQATGDEEAGTRQFKITQKAPVVQSFTSTGSTTFSVPTGVTAVDVLVVAGGAAGGSATGFESGAGGGAGGFIYTPGHPVSPGSSQTVTVGAGGSGLTNSGSNNNSTAHPVANGSNSVFGTITATGGGCGGGQYFQGSPGGSGGGEAGNYSTGNQGSGTPGQGNPGGAGTNSGPSSTAGGGGGAGATGSGGSSNNGGPGGSGSSNSISGSSVTYAGGGGGSGKYSGGGSGGSGGSGGGGNGTTMNSGNGGDGTNNRGAGGGGSVGTTSYRSGNGGSGIVIVKY